MASDSKCPSCGREITLVGTYLDEKFTHKPNDNSCLRNQLASAAAEIERLRELLQSVEWQGGLEFDTHDMLHRTCPLCGSYSPSHIAACELADALAQSAQDTEACND